MIKVPNSADLDRIVSLHYNSLKDGVLYYLGKGVLRIFYKEILTDKDSILLAYIKRNKILGVAASTKNTSRLFNKIKLKYPHRLAVAVLKKSPKDPLLLPRLLFSRYSSLIKPELLFLFVDPYSRGKGIGKTLVKATSNKFKKMGIKKYKITILSSNIKGKEFYCKFGFKKSGSYKFMNEKRDILTLDI